MTLDEIIGSLENCKTIEELSQKLQMAIENIGFSSFSFIDIGHQGLDNPFTVMTNEASWDRTYRDYGFVHTDPVLHVVRRTNLPFHWGSVSLPERKRCKTPQALKIMDAARDHGYQEGLVIPFHFTDQIGRLNSASCALFWKDKREDFFSILNEKKHEIHIMVSYWAQRIIDIAAEELQKRKRFMNSEGEEIKENILTDRERDVLSWAARGKTVSETGIILAISETTVETHIRNTMKKLGAENKSHAVAKAIYLGYI